MTTAVATLGDNTPTDAAKAIEAALARMQVRRQFVARARETGLQKSVDYGHVPGCDKETLFKSGAEALTASVTKEAEELFLGCGRFGEPQIEKAIEDFEAFNGQGHVFYRVKLALLGPSGAVLGTGVGSCSSQEQKYREFRGKNGAPPRQRPAADSANTVLKMAVKRAKVDAAIGVFGASSMFTQDVEDEGDGLDRAIGFGQHADKTWREAASDGSPDARGSGASWLVWFTQNGKKESDRKLAQEALAEAEEMRAAPARNSGNGNGHRASSSGAGPAPTPPHPSGPALDSPLVDGGTIEDFRSSFVGAASQMGLKPKTDEWTAFMHFARNRVDDAIGRPLSEHMNASDPQRPTKREIGAGLTVLKQAATDFAKERAKRQLEEAKG